MIGEILLNIFTIIKLLCQAVENPTPYEIRDVLAQAGCEIGVEVRFTFITAVSIDSIFHSDFRAKIQNLVSNQSWV